MDKNQETGRAVRRTLRGYAFRMDGENGLLNFPAIRAQFVDGRYQSGESMWNAQVDTSASLFPSATEALVGIQKLARDCKIEFYGLSLVKVETVTPVVAATTEVTVIG